MFHHATYSLTSAVALATFTDVPSVTDTVFSQQGGHFIFTDKLKLLGLSGMSATLTAAQLFSPSLLPYGLFYVWPLNLSATPASYPRMMRLIDRPFDIPLNEQIQFLVTDSGVAARFITGHIWVAPANWHDGAYKGLQRSVIKCTSSQAIIAQSWSGLGPITFANQPKGGWYVVNAAFCFSANARAFRLYFPRSPGTPGTGRQMRPGDLVSHAVGDLVVPDWAYKLGPWGAFHTFEPFQVEVEGDVAGADSQQIFLDVDYVGQGDAGGPYPLTA